jgi:hypothetical protein
MCHKVQVFTLQLRLPLSISSDSTGMTVVVVCWRVTLMALAISALWISLLFSVRTERIVPEVIPGCKADSQVPPDGLTTTHMRFCQCSPPHKRHDSAADTVDTDESHCPARLRRPSGLIAITVATKSKSKKTHCRCKQPTGAACLDWLHRTMNPPGTCIITSASICVSFRCQAACCLPFPRTVHRCCRETSNEALHSPRPHDVFSRDESQRECVQSRVETPCR